MIFVVTRENPILEKGFGLVGISVVGVLYRKLGFLEVIDVIPEGSVSLIRP